MTTGGPGRAPNRAMLRAVGFVDEDFNRPVIGVASLFSDITPCNAHLDRLARKAVERKTGARGLRSILEATLLDTMYDLPSLKNVSKVVVDESAINGESRPLVIYEGADIPKAAAD